MKCIFSVCSLVSILLFSAITASAWGKTGHRVVALLAQHNINPVTRDKVERLLGGQSLASVANYADDVKSDTAYKRYSPWHFANYPLGERYEDQHPTVEDIMFGIQKCVNVLKSDSISDKDKVFYLKYIIHLVGDLHQPLHVGRADDLGGNKISVKWMGRNTNLHSVWDDEMISFYGMSYSELESNLPIITEEQKKDIQKGSPLDWINETHLIQTPKVYASAKPKDKLSFLYMYCNFDMVQIQLQKGGLRLAALLDEIFK